MRALSLAVLFGLAASLAPSSSVSAQDSDPVFYMVQYKVSWDRVDSLQTLVAEFELPWHNFVAENVEGYQRWAFVHDTGNEYNYMTLTAYPDWDMVRGDEIPWNDLFPQFLESIGMTMEEFEALDVAGGFEWALSGSPHIDQIWRPIEPETADG